MLIFPDASTIKTHLSTAPSLSIPYLKKREIDKAISELVADRFASAKLEEIGVKITLRLAFDDLKAGKDRLSGLALPKIDINALLWNQIRLNLESDLKKCAQIQSKL